MNKKLGKKDVRFLIFLLIVHAVFLTMALMFKRIYMGDSYEFVYEAINIKEHFWFYCGNPALPVVPEYLTLRPPLYPLLLAFVYMFSVNNWIIIVLQNLLSMFNIYYLRDTIRLTGYKRKYDYLLMAFVMLYPAQFVHANTIAPDLLLQTCVLIYFRYFIKLIKTQQFRNAYWMSLALIAGFFTKPVLYPFALVHCIMLVVLALHMRRGLLKSFTAGFIPIVAILIYMGVNYTRTGEAHFTSNQSFNAVYYYYFYYNDKQGTEAAQKFLKREREIQAEIPLFADRYRHANKRGTELLRENFVPYMAYHMKHSFRLLIDPGKGEWDMFTNRLTLGRLYDAGQQQEGFYTTLKREGVKGLDAYFHKNPSFALAMLILAFNLLRLGGLALFLMHKRNDWRLRLFVAGLIAYFAITTGPIANSRYFIPISLVSIGCATLGYQRILRRKKNKAIIVQPKGM